MRFKKLIAVINVIEKINYLTALFKNYCLDKQTDTYDGDGFASKPQSSSDAHVFAATSSRPQPHGVFTAEEHDQHNLLHTHIHSQSQSHQPSASVTSCTVSTHSTAFLYISDDV